MPVLSVPKVAVVPPSDYIVVVNAPVDAHIPVDANVSIDVNRLIDVDGSIHADGLMDLLRSRRRRGSKSKRSKYGKNY